MVAWGKRTAFQQETFLFSLCSAINAPRICISIRRNLIYFGIIQCIVIIAEIIWAIYKAFRRPNNSDLCGTSPIALGIALITLAVRIITIDTTGSLPAEDKSGQFYLIATVKRKTVDGDRTGHPFRHRVK
jgi:hypothetical protein